MLESVTSAIGTVIGWIGTVIDSIITAGGETAGGETIAAGALNPLLPLFAIGIAISAILLGIKVIRSIVWGS